MTTATLYVPGTLNGEEITPANGTDFQLDELRKLLDCEWVEQIKSPDRTRMILMNEEAKFQQPRPDANQMATDIALNWGVLQDTVILGKVIVGPADILR